MSHANSGTKSTVYLISSPNDLTRKELQGKNSAYSASLLLVCNFPEESPTALPQKPRDRARLANGEVQRTVAAFRGKPRTRHSSADHLRWRTQPLGHGSPPFRRDTEIRGNAPEWLELETSRLPSSHFPWSAARPQALVIRIESLAATRAGDYVKKLILHSSYRRAGRRSCWR